MGFKLGQTVFIRTDPEQMECIVVSKTEFIGGTTKVTIGCNGSYFDLYDIELSGEMDVLKKMDVVKYEDTE
jgi:hypothetical protein